MARSAGTMLATSVTIVPVSMLTMTVRVREHRAGLRQVDAHRGEQRAHALGDAEPEQRGRAPRRAGRRPGPSSTTERITWRREAPSVRSVANSRERWATVIESVLRITNAPTNSAMPPKPSRKYVMNFRLSLVSLESAAACASPVLTSAVVGQQRLDLLRASAAGETPSLALTEMLSYCALLARTAPGRSGGRRWPARRRRASRPTRSVATPVTLYGLAGPLPAALDRVADREVVLARRAGVEDDLAVAVRPARPA